VFGAAARSFVADRFVSAFFFAAAETFFPELRFLDFAGFADREAIFL